MILMMGFEITEHTADIGLKISGSTLAEFFINAGKGFRHLIIEGDLKGNEIINSVEIDGESIEQLLVKWLEELLFFYDTERLIPKDYRINDISENSLRAEVEWAEFDPEINNPKYEIKAVTYHNLSVEKSEDHISANIIFDI